MTLDATARESNLRDSIKKYFTDNIKGTEGIDVLYDIGLATPNLRNKDITRWLSIGIGNSSRQTISEVLVIIHCVQRKDTENRKLSQLVDKVMNLLLDTTADGDGIKRITLYQSFPLPWTVIGALMVDDIIVSNDLEGMDDSNYKTLTVTLKWPAKV